MRYKPVQNGQIDNNKVMFLDFNHVMENTTDSLSNLPSIGIKVYEKNLSEETIKPTDTSRLNELFTEVLERYYMLYLRDRSKESPILEYNIKDDVRFLHVKCLMGGNVIAAEGRRGPANIFVVPNEDYYNKLSSVSNVTVVVNPTEVHKDKIFVIRVDNEMSSPGLTLFTSKNINERYHKLMKLMNRMNKRIGDLPFNYSLTDLGNEIGKFVQIVYLKDN